MHNNFARALLGQFEASLAMLDRCVRGCPPEHWDALIAKYPYWLVAYHTLYCTEGYLAPTEHDWQPHPRFHPGGRSDIDDEYPSRRFTQCVLRAYAQHVLALARSALSAETDSSLAGPSGFSRLTFSRAELHLYNLRHVQHHTGQLGAFLHRNRVSAPWVKTGWPTG
jgi:uncharacterized damage-inducible protein DinB